MSVPTLTVLSASAISVLQLQRPASVFTEMPPTLFTIPQPLAAPGCPLLTASTSTAAYLSTGYVGLCVMNATGLPVAPDAPTLGFNLASCSVPFSGESWRSYPPDGVPANTEWLRNYDGVFAAVAVPGGSAASMLLVRHGEDKNELCWANDLLYQGTVNTDVPAAECYSGFHNGTFSDCQAAYNAFVSGAVVPFTAAACFGLGEVGNVSTVDLGPLAWPTRGYLNATGGKASYGVRQPGALRGWDGAVYLTFIDSGFDYSDAWVARAPPPPPAGAPLASTDFASYSHVAGGWTLPTLPPGFDARNAAASLAVPAPAGEPGSGGAPAFPLPGSGAVHFTGARLTVAGAPSPYHLVVYDIVNYTRCWPGGTGTESAQQQQHPGTALIVELQLQRLRLQSQRVGGSGGASFSSASGQRACVPTWSLLLRLTADFVVFSDPVELDRYAAPGWPAAQLQYPALLSADGSRQDEVDAGGFYVLGTCSDAAAPCASSYGPQVTAALVSVAVAVSPPARAAPVV